MTRTLFLSGTEGAGRGAHAQRPEEAGHHLAGLIRWGQLREVGAELRDEQKNRRNRSLGSPQSATRNAHDVGICVPARA